ncbi:hypothetical protein ABPG74_003883 [Tetrahymena malaccensis]
MFLSFVFLQVCVFTLTKCQVKQQQISQTSIEQIFSLSDRRYGVCYFDQQQSKYVSQMLSLYTNLSEKLIYQDYDCNILGTFKDQYSILWAKLDKGAKILSLKDSDQSKEISVVDQKWLKFSQVNDQDYIVGTNLGLVAYISNYSKKSAQLEGCSDPISSLIYFEKKSRAFGSCSKYLLSWDLSQNISGSILFENKLELTDIVTQMLTYDYQDFIVVVALIQDKNLKIYKYTQDRTNLRQNKFDFYFEMSLVQTSSKIITFQFLLVSIEQDQSIRIYQLDSQKRPLLEYGKQEHKGMQITDIISIQDKIISGDEKGVLIERQIDDSLNKCMQGYYLIADDCLKCNDTCKTCESSASNCTSCFENQQRELKQLISTQICTCKQNYFDGSDSVCVGCHPTCQTCWLPNNPQKCSSCDESDSIQGNKQTQTLLFGLQQKCLCKEGFYYDENYLCKKCPINCKTCNSSSQCTSCVTNPNFSFQLTDGKCKCPLGYYVEGDDPACKKCPQQCKSCENSQECLECQDPFNNNRFTHSQDKLCSCMSGYYYDGKNIKCQQCSKYCQKCDSQSNCLECQPNLNRAIQSNGQCQCQEGFYEQNSGLPACTQCPYSCKACDNNGKCTSCPEQNLFFRKQIGSQNNCDCIDGYYDDGKSKECQKCDEKCFSCTQKGKCLKCLSNDSNNFSVLVDSNGNCLCKDGYYLDDSLQCKKCPYNCKTCQNNNECLSCNEDQNYFRKQIDKSNKCECQQGYYDKGQLMCERCPINCLQCDMKGCTQCSQDSNRKTIQESANCECKDGYFQLPNQPQCQKCPYNCLTCDNNGICLSCDSKSNRKSISLSKTCDCQDGYYEDQNSKECKKCSQNCMNCSSYDKCTACDEKQFRILNQKTGQCDCKEGYFENKITLKCEKCHQNCKSCLGSSINQCTSCFSEQNRILKDNICVCQSDFIENNEKLCQIKCHYSCDKCSGTLQNQCLNCGNKSITFREFNSQKQICQCSEGYYDIQGQQNCNKCHDTCNTCSSQTKNSCLTCSQKDFRVFDKQSNSCICINGYYENQQTGLCEKCHYSCQECFGNGENQCSKCDELNSKRKLNENNQCKCTLSYHEIDQKCEAEKQVLCDLTCQICDQENNQICNKCKADVGLQYDSTNKKCVCNSGWYFNKQKGACLQCDQNCETCEQNSNQCLTCKTGKQLNIQNKQCETVVFPSNIPKTVIQQVYNVTESSTYVSVGATASGSILLSFISPNGNLVSQFLSIQKLNLILLVNLALPELLYVFFKAVGGNSPLTLIQNLNILNKYIVHDSSSPKLGNKFTTENIDSSIFVNGGGILTVVVSILTIFIPSVFLYKNNFLIVNQLHQFSLFAQRSKKIYENIVSSALIQVHEIIMLVSYFSIGTQLISLFLYGFEESLSYYRLVFTLIITIYFCVFLLISYKVLNNKLFTFQRSQILQREMLRQSYDSYNEAQSIYKIKKTTIWLEIIYKHMKQDLIEQQWITLNFKLIYQVIENFIIPFCIIFFYFNYKLQVGFCLFFQIILFIISIKCRPYKQSINNFSLIVDQFSWVSIFASILILGQKINSMLEKGSNIPNSDIDSVDKASWAIMIFCLIILFFNPLIIMIKFVLSIPQIVKKIRSFIQSYKRRHRDKNNQQQENIELISDQNLSFNNSQFNSNVWNICSLNRKENIVSSKTFNFNKQKTLDKSLIKNNTSNKNYVLQKKIKINKKQFLKDQGKLNEEIKGIEMQQN